MSKTKRGRLLFRWLWRGVGDGPDWVCDYPRRKADAAYVSHLFTSPQYDYDGTRRPSVAEELDAIGYDTTTLRFQIDLKETDNG